MTDKVTDKTKKTVQNPSVSMTLVSPMVGSNKQSKQASMKKKSKKECHNQPTHVYRQCIADRVASMTSKGFSLLRKTFTKKNRKNDLERIAAYLAANVKNQKPRDTEFNLATKPITPLTYPKFKHDHVKI